MLNPYTQLIKILNIDTQPATITKTLGRTTSGRTTAPWLILQKHWGSLLKGGASFRPSLGPERPQLSFFHPLMLSNSPILEASVTKLYLKRSANTFLTSALTTHIQCLPTPAKPPPHAQEPEKHTHTHKQDIEWFQGIKKSQPPLKHYFQLHYGLNRLLWVGLRTCHLLTSVF